MHNAARWWCLWMTKPDLSCTSLAALYEVRSASCLRCTDTHQWSGYDMFLYFSPICLESNWNPTSMKKAWENRSEQVYGHAEHAKVTDQNPADLGGFPSGCENGTGGSRPLQTQWLSPLQYLIPLLSGSWNHYRFSLQLIQRENITQISDLLLSLYNLACSIWSAMPSSDMGEGLKLSLSTTYMRKRNFCATLIWSKKANTFSVGLWHTYTAFLHVPVTRKTGRFWNYVDLHLNIFYFWERHQSPIFFPFLCKMLYANPDSLLYLLHVFMVF